MKQFGFFIVNLITLPIILAAFCLIMIWRLLLGHEFRHSFVVIDVVIEVPKELFKLACEALDRFMYAWRKR